MNYFTNGYELSTAITNLFISLFAFISFFNIKKYKNKLWNAFFITLVFDGILGFIIHGVNMSSGSVNFYWAILLIGFCFTINILLAIFINELIKEKIKLLNIIILSIILYIVLLLELFVGIDFLITFIIYASICLLIITIESALALLKKNTYSLFYILAIFFQVIGGLFLIYKKGIYIFDKNGVYHIYMILTILFFYLGSDRKLMLNEH